ncbi:MAG: tRNA (adenosine(37)-N6)-threonylcarbamoyltransferase complex dimerization subunit type 1 TsaB [Nitrospinae bacterium]|nr:tRNA (adenosine(37)-N6)-threonylcarbamoyltransferase complex dimerization subunit type 1 TsaB [Nitrospinota bacterium]
MDDPRYILALDTSTPRGRCSLLCSTGSTEEEALLSGEVRISRTLLPHVEQLLNSRNIPADMIQAVGVSIGPGTFTGLRVGLSCAKGLSLGWGCPLYGFSSLEIMAMAALLNEMRTGRNLPDYILPYRDARYGELFTALFQVSGNPESSRGNPLSRVREDEIIAPVEFRLPEDGDTLLAGQKEELPESLAIGASQGALRHHDIDSSAVATAWLTHKALESRTPPHSANISLNYCRKSQAQTKWADPKG